MQSSRPKSTNCRSLIAASFLLIGLSGCSHTPPEFTPLKRQLPGQPAFAKPVAVQAGQPGESCYVAYDRQKSGVKQANSIIGRYNKWYSGVRGSYGGAK